MNIKHTFVAPLAIHYQGGNRILNFADIPRRVTNIAEGHRVMQSIAHTLGERAPGHKFTYQQPDDE